VTPDDKRIDLDSQDPEDLAASLARDLAEATRTAKAQREKDAAREARAAQRQKDAALKYGLIFIGAVLVFILAYWMVFVRPEVPAPTSSYSPPPAAVVRPTPQQPIQPPVPINRPPANPQMPHGTAPPAATREQPVDDQASPDM